MKVGRIISELRNAELMVPIWSRVNGKNVVIAIPSRKIVACFSTTLSYNAPLLFLRYHYAREWNNNMEEESSTEYRKLTFDYRFDEATYVEQEFMSNIPWN